MEDDRVAILEAQLAQAKLIAEEADKKYEEVSWSPPVLFALWVAARERASCLDTCCTPSHLPFFSFLSRFHSLLHLFFTYSKFSLRVYLSGRTVDRVQLLALHGTL